MCASCVLPFVALMGPSVHSILFSDINSKYPRLSRLWFFLCFITFTHFQATLSVIVHRIRNLLGNGDLGAYVKLRLIESIVPGRSFRVNHTKRKTARKSGLHPVFEETLTYLLPPHELKMRRLETTLCQESRILGKTNVISRCIVCLDKIQASINNGDENPSFTDW